MKCAKSINIYHVLVTIISLGIIFYIGSINPIEAVKKNGTELEDYNNSKELVGDIKNGNFSDDQISLNDIKNSGAYKNADKDMHDCIKLAAKIGHNLKDREIVHCYEDANYFKQKYSIGDKKTNNTNIKGADSINYATVADTNATSTDTNGTSTDTNGTSTDTNGTSTDITATSTDITATSADTNVTTSKYDTNATSADTNMTGSSSDTNATSADTNMTGSSSDTNATSADTNASKISITDIFNRPYFRIS
jgi:hypothetical protein